MSALRCAACGWYEGDPVCDVDCPGDLAAARDRCERARWPEQHDDNCAWCAHLTASRGPL